MFVLLRDVSAAKQVIATLLATALVLWASGLFSAISAQAANITTVSDTLSDSAPAASSTHTFVFSVPSGVANGSYATITMPTGEFGGIGNLAATDVTVDITGSGAQTVAANCAGADNIGFSTSGDDLIFEFCLGDGASIGAGGTTTITVGNTAGNEMRNPTPAGDSQSYEIDISAGASDSGHTRVVIVSTVLVTAIVDTVFDFTVAGVATTTLVGSTESTTDTSGTTTLDFKQLVAGVPEILGQRLNVDTNAANGFVVTVHKDGAFESSTGADIDDFDDGVFSDSPAGWTSPATTLGDEDTYGHWGLTSLDTDSNGNRAAEHVDNQYVSVGTSTAKTVIMASAGPTQSSTSSAQYTGSTTVGYKVEISALQEAGDDYQAVLTYIATPTF